ncbi:ethylene-responsive transcription factor ERF119-like [Lotus japonicus]|uniref:ethylene-responsive transcription factor ERF119-like n=1 Tax=Lotus japonicus TaxID=34305 RepID=UPI002590F6A4|nr:ethylene-responsive transcription factor ERF119-like [Lotus japonicus]
MSKFQKQPASRRLRPQPLPEFKMGRKLLVIYDDPHATESSDDESQSVPTEKKLGKIKRCITEIPLPPLVPVISGSAGTSSFAEKRINMSSKNVEVHNKKRVSTQNPSTSWQPYCKLRGVRLRKSGKWGSGTYNTAEEASQAYESMRLEIEAMTKARVPNNGSSDKGPASNSSSADAEVAEGSASEKPSAEANDMVAELAGLEIPDLSLLNLPPTPPAAAVVPTGSKPNPVLDIDFLADYAGQGFDDDTNLGGCLEDIPIFGVDNNEPSQLPDFNFGDFDSDGFAG